MVHWIKGKLNAKNHGPDSRYEQVQCLFRDRQTDIVAYRLAVCNLKGSLTVHWVLDKIECKKFKGLDKGIRKL